MKNLFLVLAIAGAVVPYLFFIDFFMEEGLLAFLPALFINGAAGGFSADLVISSLAFWLLLIHRQVSNYWLYVVLNLTIGLSCALPLYCYMALRQETSVSQ
jgi:hypothetical protein